MKSFHSIGAAEVGLVSKAFAFRKLTEDNPIAFRGEAGYQATMLMPGLRFKFWPMFSVKKFPWVQVPAGEIGVVIAQVGAPLPIGAKSAVYKPEFANFSDLAQLRRAGRPEGRAAAGAAPGHSGADAPGRVPGDHDADVYGMPVSPELVSQSDKRHAHARVVRPVARSAPRRW